MADKRAIIEQIRGINFKLKILPILDYYQIDYTEHIEGRYRAICPFHNDHSPSLEIFTDNDSGQDSWCCFPCDLNGDCFRFIQQMTGNFKEAVAVAQEIIKGLKIDGAALNQKYKEQQEKRRMAKKLFVIQHRLGVQYRDWLESLRDSPRYEQARGRVDEIFQEMDEIVAAGDYEKADAYLREKEQKLRDIIEKSRGIK